MSMPLGAKIATGYATVEGGGDYRMIAEVMTAKGHKMNHSSARNWLLQVMRGFAEDLLRARDMPVTEEEVNRIARTPMFQSAINDMYENYIHTS